MHRVLITGSSGYVGLMLVEKFLARPDVDLIIALDKEPSPEDWKKNPKIICIQKNTADAWEIEAAQYEPDIVVHTAWQIRDMYGRSETQHRWNIVGTDKVFDFALARSSVRRLVHFSTVASYGAFAENEIEHLFTEEELFRVSEYRYAEEKRVSEEHLATKYEAARSHGAEVDVAIIRPAAITGPRGRFARIRFGLQSALSGQLSGSFMYSLVSALTSFIPATPKWARQFIHEDDIVDGAELLAFDSRVKGYQAYNLCPPGRAVLSADMARAVGKKVVPIAPQFVRFAFFILWHVSMGKIPTSRGAWRGYSYPIIVTGEKFARTFGFVYRMSPLDAFMYTDGRYESSVPEGKRKHRV